MSRNHSPCFILCDPSVMCTRVCVGTCVRMCGIFLYFRTIQVPVFVYLVPVTLISIVVFTFGTLSLESVDAPSLVGWYHPHYLECIAYLAIVTGLLGIATVAFVMKYLSSLIVSVVLLMEPVTAALLGILLHVEGNPSVMTAVGALLVTSGVLIVATNGLLGKCSVGGIFYSRYMHHHSQVLDLEELDEEPRKSIQLEIFEL